MYFTGIPKFISVEIPSGNKHILILKYFTGTAGIHDLVDIFGACIYDKNKHLALTDITLVYVSKIRTMREPEQK